MVRAWLISISILLAAGGLWLCAFLFVESMSIANGLLWFTPIVAGFFMGRHAPKRKLINGFLLAIPTVLLFGATAYLDGTRDITSSFKGVEGAVTAMVLLLPTALGFCGLGAILAKYFFSKTPPETSTG